MTTELEKKFFEAFDIKPEEEKYCYWECKKPELENIACDNTKCEYYKHKIYYPEITDQHYLELICIINQADLRSYGENDYFMALNYKDLKEEVIAKCKRLADKNAFSEVTGEHIKHQVKKLFKENK